ncbi:hypothetical protein [Amphritea balenae]|uniref:Uncharacterized protein n=1 Tax=Amphritea balenae TaxID=452629 RepID=A0A3P1SS14_9GAMM|nr:hypothetical protein [Amphritea balenae]RRC99966.1 hypothetical protein EHS89_07050 [Amphritea balenae]GGK75417.1 hypothetical protein GCM10007941_26980 [Amphritea balenae]
MEVVVKLRHKGFAMRIAGYLLLLLNFNISSVWADDALQCIQIGKGDRSQSILNKCDFEVEVLWCHNRDEPGYNRGLCASRGKFYQKQAVLQPAEIKQNQFSLPFKSTLYIAACKGGFHTTKQVGMKGGYLCK